jgi:purine-binding chemotaxis protein CheW
MRLLLFTIDEHRYGVPAESVGEIVRAVAVTPLPNAPAVIEGVIDLRGAIVPVFDLRRRFGLSRREVDPADHFVIVRAPPRTAVLHVDRVLELADVDDDAIQTLAGQVQSADHVTGVAALADGLAVIHDVSSFLSAAESESLDAALDAASDAASDPVLVASRGP